MKKRFTYYIYMSLIAMLGLVSCQFDYSDPDESHDIYTYDTEATGTTITIGGLKEKYKPIINDASNRNRWTLVESDEIFDGYVCANDISGNIYQSIYVRKGDDAIQVGINDNSLWTTYPVGTHVVINLKGLYIGSYGNMAKIGTPYTTSGNNHRLGGMTKFKAPTSIKVIGFDDTVEECQPVEIDASWLKLNSGANAMHKWAPMLVKVKNAEIKGFNNRKVYAVYDDRDAGNGVNNSILIDGQSFILRQSALSDFSSEKIPVGPVDVTAVLTRYSSDWQFTLRDKSDVVPVVDEEDEQQPSNEVQQ